MQQFKQTLTYMCIYIGITTSLCSLEAETVDNIKSEQIKFIQHLEEKNEELRDTEKTLLT